MPYLMRWLESLMVLLIFAAVVEWTLPQGETRRYVRVVVGLVILVGVLTPLLDLLGQSPEWAPEEWPDALQTEVVEPAAGGDDWEATRRAGALTAARLASAMETEVLAVAGIGSAAVDLEWELGDEGAAVPFHLERVKVRITALAERQTGAESEDVTETSTIEIGAIRVGEDPPSDPMSAGDQDSPQRQLSDSERRALAAKVRERLAIRFGLLEDEIHVSFTMKPEGEGAR